MGPRRSMFGGQRFVPAPANRARVEFPTISIHDLNQFLLLLAEPSSTKTQSEFWLNPGEYQIQDQVVSGKFQFEVTGKSKATFTFKFTCPDFMIPEIKGIAVQELEWVSGSDSAIAQSTDESPETLCLKPKKTEDGELIFRTGQGFNPTPRMNFKELNPFIPEPCNTKHLVLRTRGDMVFGMCCPPHMYILHTRGLEGLEHVYDQYRPHKHIL